MVYLKAVEAYGFKSFADKTTVTFDKGLTAIVGPNGSGKSNITDAIRWVLGEQSAKNLRGARMEDVIFSGAQNRAPLNYADVTLKLDNTMHLIESDDEINVTRRLYRSGESEYFLNGKKSRLKDITELFLDTGLGKEAFSIISQGKVDEILNAKAEDRRHLIEEAAGVLKYKKRKKETTQKLEETMLNLSRVNDIIFDLEARVEPLAEQAAIAEEYQTLMAEMKEADIEVTVHDIKVLRNEHQKLEQQLTEFKEMILIKQDKLTRLEEKLSTLKEIQSSKKAESIELNKTILMLTETIERSQGQLGILNEKKDNQSRSSERMEAEKEKLLKQIDAQKEKLKSVSEEQKILNDELKEKKKSERALEKELTEIESDLEQVIEATKDNYYEVLSRQTNSNNELKLIEKQLNELDQFFESYKGDDEVIEYDEQRSAYDDLVKTLNDSTSEIEASRERYKTLAKELNQKTTVYRELEEKMFQAHRYLDQLKTKHQSLIAMQEDYQGYFQGVKAVLKKQLPGIHGPVMKQIDIDSRYQIALDIALGAQLQNIITEDEESARQAIQFLKSNKLGRATFLPLTTIKSRAIAQSDLMQINHAGYIGPLSSLVTTHQKYLQIIDNLMGRILVVNTLKDANEIARQVQFKYKIVTLDGNTVNPGGSMTGGSVNQPSILLKQKEETQSLAEKIREYEQSTLTLEKQIKTEKEEAAELNFQLDRCRQTGEALSERRTDLIFQKGQLENKLNTLQQKKDESQAAEQKRIDLNNLTDEKTKLLTDIASDKEELIQLEQKIEHFNDAKRNKKQMEQELSTNLSNMRGQRIQLSERVKYIDESIAEVNDRITQLEYELDQLNEQSKVTNIKDIEEMIAQHQLTLKESTESRLNSTQMLNEVSTVLDENEQTLNETSEQYNETQRQINGLENGIGEMKSKYSRMDVQLENLIYHLMEDYHITFEAACAYENPDSDIEARRTRVTLTKRSIEELGPVNISAIEQYKEVKERYDFLTEQEEDLKQAKHTLESVIYDLDKEVSERFETTFKSVQRNFNGVFQELFGGGTGELLLDSDDLLTAGVEMIIEPPGKKRQHLTLLSGGERALTAVALLFAILKVRSAPFVILDEVEAALDEANVLRFGSYLKNMSSETQFIVITHRKGTMEASDRLYGVTMQNSGITQLVSVDLSELSNEKVKELTK